MEKIERQPILEVSGLTFSYDGKSNVLEAVNLTVYEGERIAVLGANGSGKSTFFLNLNGVLSPQKGEIIYQGKVMTHKNINELRKCIGIVFQDADNQIIASTVKAEVSFGPMNLKLSKDEVIKRVDMALAYMNLSEFRDKPPHYLSGGEKKRVSIADIIAMESEIIIFDEPTAALDPVNAIMLEEVLKKLSDERKTMLISTHDVDFAYRFAERVLVLCEGEIIADGTPMEVFENESVITRANLKKPMLLDVVQVLERAGIFENHTAIEQYPNSIEAFQNLISNLL